MFFRHFSLEHLFFIGFAQLPGEGQFRFSSNRCQKSEGEFYFGIVGCGTDEE